jgi:hypothetical protein
MKIAEIEAKQSVAEEKPVVVQMANRALHSAKIRKEKAKNQASQKKSRDRLRTLQKQARDALTDDLNDFEAKRIKRQKNEINADECGFILDV